MSTLRPEEKAPLTGNKYGVAISWDRHGNKVVDCDIQAVVVDDKGSIIDAVYYNNMKALKCLTHSGDEQTGEKAGLDEVIWFLLGKVPENVQMIIYVVAAHSGGHLRDVENGTIHLLEEKKENEVTRFAMERTKAEVDVVATMQKDESGGWFFQIVEEPAVEGQHFMDILEPTIGNIIRKAIPGAPKRQKVAFAMDKGSVVDLPESSKLQRVTAGLGWDVRGKGVDLDVSAVLFDSGAKVVNTVFFGNLKACGVKHSGDNLTGEGDGDDEQIQIDLGAVPSQVHQVFLVVNIYTKNVTFDRVKNAYCRIFDSTNAELARFVLQEAGSKSCLLMARLFREAVEAARWSFQALGTFSTGSMWKDAVPDMQRLLRTPARQLQFQESMTGDLQNRTSSGVIAPVAPPSGGRTSQKEARAGTVKNGKPPVDGKRPVAGKPPADAECCTLQ
mmetsp:Transcript_20319/g.46636  ORF Transcript_20319/g.46636 Transcript_20319/m.46636 type:complete len:445 (+) Transcript_20319:120-1454(+)